MRSQRLRLAGWVAVVATPVAAWWLIGDRSETGLEAHNRDYFIRAPHVSSWIVTTAGALALLAFMASVAVFALGVTRDQLDRRWIGVFGLLSLAGVLLAFGGRIATAGVDGANIGAGLCLIVGGPLLIAIVIIAFVLTSSIHRRPVR